MDANIRATLDYFKHSKATEPLRRIYVQGTLWQFLVEGYWATPPRREKGVKIKDFSAKSRLAAMKFGNTVNWTSGSNAMFMTFTYPDHCLPRTNEQLNRDRYVIHRHIERIKGRLIPVWWRREQEEREYGKWKGHLQPHWHFICFDVGFIPYKELRLAWRHAIHAEEEPHMDFKPIWNGPVAGGYISKYVAKAFDRDRLVNLPNHNSGGRQIGYLRKPLIPRHRPAFFTQLTENQAMELTRFGASVLSKLDASRPRSFCLFGPKMGKALQMMAEWGLAKVPTP